VPVGAEALVSRDTFKTALGVSGSMDDTLIDSIIDRATAWIQSVTGRKLKARHYKLDQSAFTTSVTSEDYLYFDGDEAVANGKGLGEFYLPQYPVQRSSVASALAFELAYLSSRGSGGDTFTALTANVDYLVDYERGVVRLLAGRFTSGVRNYRITCTAGYVTIPPDLEALCIELGRLIYKDRKNLQSETIGSWSRSFNTAKDDPLVSDVLAHYTRLSLPLGL